MIVTDIIIYLAGFVCGLYILQRIFNKSPRGKAELSEESPGE